MHVHERVVAEELHMTEAHWAACIHSVTITPHNYNACLSVSLLCYFVMLECVCMFDCVCLGAYHVKCASMYT